MQDNDKMIDKILNKEFKRAILAGYDAYDVDAFFDSVIEYLKNINSNDKTFMDEINKLQNEKKQLQEELDIKTRELSEKNKLIKQLHDEGYSNIHTNRRISNLEEKINK